MSLERIDSCVQTANAYKQVEFMKGIEAERAALGSSVLAEIGNDTFQPVCDNKPKFKNKLQEKFSGLWKNIKQSFKDFFDTTFKFRKNKKKC